MNDSELNNSVVSFLAWERSSRDTIDFKRIYVDLAGDLVAGLVLSQIVYWYLPDKNGQTKLRVSHDGKLWIAKARSEWWDEIRVGPRQFDRAVALLEKKSLVESSLHRFNGSPVKHVRLLWDNLLPGLSDTSLHPPENPYSVDDGLVGNEFVINDQLVTDSLNPFNESVKSLTETTTETQNTNTLPDVAKATPAVVEPASNDSMQSLQEKALEQVPSSMATPPVDVVPPIVEPPVGYEWWMSDNDPRNMHLLKDGKGRPLCKVTPFRYSTREPIKLTGLTPCPTCLQIATKKPAKPKASAYNNQTIFDALVRCSWGDIAERDRIELDGEGGRVGKVRQWLVARALRMQKLDDLTDNAITLLESHIDTFADWFAGDCPGCSQPKDLNKFKEAWLKYINTPTARKVKPGQPIRRAVAGEPSVLSATKML